jgi:abortive infection bacteriophage resistance protein
MKFEKPALTFEEQADLLLARGLCADRVELVKRLQATNYFRFCAYAWVFQEGDRYQTGITLEQVWRLYTFDHRLRTLFIDAIESIEVQVRTLLAYQFAHKHGSFAYLEESNFPNFDPKEDDFNKWKAKLKGQVKQSVNPKGAEIFVVNYFRDHGDAHDLLPVWMMVELMDFGSTLSFFRGVSVDIRKELAKTIGQPEEVILSWLMGLHVIRNRCAHHARLWNWQSGTSVKRPNKRKFKEWWQPTMPKDRMGMLLTICRHWLNCIAPTNTWTARVFELFDQYPEIDTSQMGLPSNWKEHPLWSDQK